MERLLAEAGEGKRALFMAAPNWAEVRYMLARKAGRAACTARWPDVGRLPIEIVAADRRLAERAGEIKETRKMSLADCFAAALTERLGADVYTGDPEFREVEGDIRVVWL